MFPLLLLETMRDMDRPEEVLEDEDLAVSLPRRFGLNDVVTKQIHRFREEVRSRRLQSAHDVEGLIRLVVRRPDAEEIFRRAGRRLAREEWEQRGAGMRRMVRLLPRPLGLVSAKRAAYRLFSQLVGGGKLRVNRWPIGMRIAGSITAQADPGGAACAFHSGAYEELLSQYTGRPYRVRHSRCEAHGDEVCEWTVRLRKSE